MNKCRRLFQNITLSLYIRKNVFITPPFTAHKLFRNIHDSPLLNVKMFMEHENQYAYDIMKSKGYAINLNVQKKDLTLSKEQFDKLLQQDWTKKSVQYIFECFPKFGVYCLQEGLSISNTVFDDYIDNVAENIKHASDAELQSFFYSILQWPEPESIRTRNYIEVWVALDDECLNRMKQWSFDKMLSFVSLFYMLNVTRYSDFSLKCLQKCTSKAKQLTTGQLVQTMFFVGVLRKAPFDMHNLEVELENKFSNFSVDDLAVMSLGFFKSKTPIRSQALVSKIIDKITQESQNIHEVSLAALLKVIRYSMKITNSDNLYRMLEALQHEVPKLSIMCNVHLALVGTSTLTMHKNCLTAIANNVIESMNKARLKDLERLVLTFGLFNFNPDTKACFFQTVINELRNPDRLQEIEKHSRSFACCVAHLGLSQSYPIDLINKILSPEFLEKAYGKQCIVYGREILALHNISEIFCSDVKINHLSEKAARILAKKYTDYMPHEEFQQQFNVVEKMILDITKILQAIRGGTQYVIGEHILTHHQRGDLIMCNNHDGSPAAVDQYFNSKTFGTIRKPPDDRLWIALVIGGRNSVINNYNVPTGPFVTKMRELKTLGYYVSLAQWRVYTTLQTKEEKREYLESLIKEALNNK